MAAPRWTIANYNAFLREARAEWDLSLGEARELYREVRAWKTEAAYGADVERYADFLQTERGQVQITDSVLYDLDVVPEAEPDDFEYYDDDFVLEPGAEVELTAETYGEDEQ